MSQFDFVSMMAAIALVLALVYGIYVYAATYTNRHAWLNLAAEAVIIAVAMIMMSLFASIICQVRVTGPEIPFFIGLLLAAIISGVGVLVRILALR